MRPAELSDIGITAGVDCPPADFTLDLKLGLSPCCRFCKNVNIYLFSTIIIRGLLSQPVNQKTPKIPNLVSKLPYRVEIYVVKKAPFNALTSFSVPGCVKR